jgi:hypothetical protein
MPSPSSGHFTLKIDSVWTSETSVPVHNITRRHNSEDLEFDCRMLFTAKTKHFITTVTDRNLNRDKIKSRLISVISTNSNFLSYSGKVKVKVSLCLTKHHAMKT